MREIKTWTHFHYVREDIAKGAYKIIGRRLDLPVSLLSKEWAIAEIECFFNLNDAGKTYVVPFVQMGIFKNFDPNALTQNILSNEAGNVNHLGCLGLAQNDMGQDCTPYLHAKFGSPLGVLEKILVGDWLSIGFMLYNLDYDAGHTIDGDLNIQFRLVEI